VTPLEAQRQIMVLEKVLAMGPIPSADLPTDVVASLVNVGLLEVTGRGVSATGAAAHYAKLIDAI
jgi:hypothetical protein